MTAICSFILFLWPAGLDPGHRIGSPWWPKLSFRSNMKHKRALEHVREDVQQVASCLT